MEQLAPALHSNKSAPERRRDRCQFGTLGYAHGSSYNGRNNIKLQEIDERSRNNGNMANRIWQRLWGHGARQHQNGTEGYQRNFCDDSR
jgi:hypothetical protein